MKATSPDQNQQKQQQRHLIETVFSSWNQLFDLERNRARSLAGFQTRLEQCLFVDTLKKIN